MSVLEEVHVGARSLEPLAAIVEPEVVADTAASLKQLAARLDGRVLWNVNSTARGGGVAELLQSLLAYVRGAGVDARWMVIRGDERFFKITKRLHHALHGDQGDGTRLGDAARSHYERVLRHNAEELAAQVEPGDPVLLHDPQTAGLIDPLVQRGCLVVWRCHVGADTIDRQVEDGWAFLRGDLERAHGWVFSREQFAPDFLPRARCRFIAPCVDPLAPKNQPLAPDVARAVLVHCGILEGPEPDAARTFRRADGSLGRVERCADVMRLGRAPLQDTPLIAQVSRWDTLKDPIGVLRGFERFVDGEARPEELVLAGPNVHAVADDPEGAEVFDAVLAAWRTLPHGLRRRVHLVNLPMADVEENAAIVNALQRHAAVVVQKSLHEGFGLTVTEAMWKERPVVASRVGGIADQIEDGVSGVLLPDPTDLDAFAGALRRVCDDAALAARLGARARRRVVDRFLCNRHFRAYAELLMELEAGGGTAR